MTSPSLTTSINLGSAATPQQTSNNGGPNAVGSSSNDGSIESVMLDFVQSNYTKIKQSRVGTEKQWYINLAFFFGQQYVQAISTPGTTSGYRLTVPKAPPWRVRLCINKIRPIVRRELAILFGQKPRFDVYPASTDDEDLDAARAAEQVFNWIYTDKDVKEKLRQAGWWTCNTGTGFIKTYWDANAVDSASNQKGDICIEPVTPFNLFVPNFRCLDIEEQPFIIHATTKDPQYVANTFGQKIAPNVSSNDNILDDSFLNIRGAQQQSANQVLILEAWIKPGAHPRLPKGGMVTVAGGKVVQCVEKYPYDHGKFPFDKIENIPSGKFYATSMVDDLIPIQKEYNRCYDIETEILTSDGWKLGIDLQIGDSVLTYDHKSGRMKFDTVKEIFSKQYEGPVTVLEGAQISSRTTPGHRWSVKSSAGYSKIVTKLTSDHSIPLKAPVDIIGSDEYNLNKLVGLVLSDGRINNNKIFISQSQLTNPSKCDEIENLLSDELIAFSTYFCPNDIIDYYIPADYSWRIKQLIPNKRLSSNYIMSLGEKGLQGLFDGLMLGDGMYEGNKGAKFYTSLESEADLFQMICILLGKAAVVRKQLARSSWSVRPYQYIVQVKTEKFSKAKVSKALKNDEHYSGIIWCPTVDSGFVMVRRNGKAFISGNTRSQIVENKNLLGKMKLLAAKGSIDASKVTSEPGQVVFYQLGMPPPTPMQLPSLPSYVMETVQQLDSDLLEISGRNENNPQITSATALSFQQEQDETMLSDTASSIESCTERIGQKCLALVGQYWTTARTIKVVGTNESFDATILKGEDLKGCTDLRVEGGSALPQSRAAKQAFIMDLIKLQVIPPQQALEMLEIGGIDKIYDEYLTDKKAAERENMRMQAGQNIYANEWDNHQLHVQVHNRFRKGQTFESLPEEQQIAFQNHVLMHQSAINNQTKGDPTGSGNQVPAPDPMGQLNPGNAGPEASTGGNLPVGGPDVPPGSPGLPPELPPGV